VNDFYRRNGGACTIRKQASHAGVCHQRDIGKVKDLPNAIDIGIGLSMNETWITIACITSNAFGSEWVGFVTLEAKRDRESIDAEFTNILLDGSHTGLAG
jgi:hypothetical protein